MRYYRVGALVLARFITCYAKVCGVVASQLGNDFIISVNQGRAHRSTLFAITRTMLC